MTYDNLLSLMVQGVFEIFGLAMTFYICILIKFDEFLGRIETTFSQCNFRQKNSQFKATFALFLVNFIIFAFIHYVINIPLITAEISASIPYLIAGMFSILILSTFARAVLLGHLLKGNLIKNEAGRFVHVDNNRLERFLIYIVDKYHIMACVATLHSIGIHFLPGLSGFDGYLPMIATSVVMIVLAPIMIVYFVISANSKSQYN